jgi:hypothetical protein
MVTMPREWYALLTNEAISTTQFSGRQQAAKPAVDAPVHCEVIRLHGQVKPNMKT